MKPNRKLINYFSCTLTLAMMFSMVAPSVVLAEGEEPPAEETTQPDEESVVIDITPAPFSDLIESAEEDPAEEGDAETPGDDTGEGESAGGCVNEADPEEPPAEEVPPTEEGAGEAPEPEETLAEVVEALEEAEVVLVDETGEEIPLASVEAAEVLTAADPWYETTTAGVYDGWATTDLGCAPIVYSSGGTCHASTTPVQSAVDNAPANTTITIEGTYQEQIEVIGKNLSLVAGSSGGGLIAPATMMFPSTGDMTLFGLIYIENANVNIQGLTLSGSTATSFTSTGNVGEQFFTGVIFNGTSATGSVECSEIFGFNTSAPHKTATGVLVNNAEQIVIANNDIHDNERGVTVRGVSGSSSIVGNNIQNNDFGIWVETGSADITCNTIANSTWGGIHLINQAMTISNTVNITSNDIYGNPWAIYTKYAGTAINPIEIHNNNLIKTSASTYTLRAKGGYVDARENYWEPLALRIQSSAVVLTDPTGENPFDITADCLDSDGDGVCDRDDICPGFDDNVDSDGDGTPDGCDICPGFDDNLDTDGDGTPNGCDVCPNDADNDADGDGVCAPDDLCPFDSGKTDPGACGCGIADTDLDGDGLADCVDACPNDADNDADGDGVCGDVDNCRYTYNPGQQDYDGDGMGNECDPTPNVQPVPGEFEPFVLIPITSGELVELPCTSECVILQLPDGTEAEFCGLCGYWVSLSEELEETIPLDMPDGANMQLGMTVVLMDPDQNLLDTVPPGATLKLAYPIGSDTSVEDLHMHIYDPTAKAWVELTGVEVLDYIEAYAEWPGTCILLN